GTYVFRLTVVDDEGDSGFDQVTVTVSSESAGGESLALRINTGGGEAMYNGELFSSDQYFDTGSTLSRPQTGLTPPYSTIRYSPSQTMGYSIPLANGDYTVILHFAEVWFGATGGGTGGVGSRVFDVRLEDQLVLDNLDVYAEVGAQSQLLKSFEVLISDGILNIDFSSLSSDGGTRHPIINAIEVLGTNTKAARTLIDNKEITFNKGLKTNIVIEYDNFISEEGHIMLSPNPTNMEATIYTKDQTFNLDEIYLFDNSGRLVKKYDAKKLKSYDNQYKITIDDLENGTYFITMSTDSGLNYYKQLVVKK
ncbi:malectin domain-containing carbohydrate-binding protein, partial [Arenibacter sp. GZD96]|uniref:malectin domain-containing carbohydrate-binding protein n=1 Tax=Aurantibrevibacter litoralis TaxID=3106030 RepID=UPI002B0015DC